MKGVLADRTVTDRSQAIKVFARSIDLLAMQPDVVSSPVWIWLSPLPSWGLLDTLPTDFVVLNSVAALSMHCIHHAHSVPSRHWVEAAKGLASLKASFSMIGPVKESSKVVCMSLCQNGVV